MTVVRRGAAVLGSPIAHSLSPVLHQAAYDALGLADWTYRAIECPEADLDAVLHRLDDEGLAGVSLTMPLKRAVLPLLGSAEPLATEVGAVNTVLFDGVAGQWWGANTDVPGIVDVLAGFEVPSSAVVLGAGATAASAVVALALLGVAAVTVRARRPDAATDVARLAAARGLSVAVDPWPVVAADLASPLVVSTVPVGAADGLAAMVGDVAGGVLFDVVYAPWPTALAAAWSARGGVVVGGLELLVAQAAHQVRLMTGDEAPVAVMRAAGAAALGT